MAKSATITEAQAALRMGDLDRAETIAQACARKATDRVRALHVLALCALHRGQADRAAELAQKRLKALADADGFFLLGQVRATQGKMPEAIRAFDETLRLRPGLVPAIVSKAEVLEKTREREKATQLLRDLRASGRLDAEGAGVYARLLIGQEAYAEAVDLLAEYLALLPAGDLKRWDLLLRLGYCRECLGQFDEAFGAYREANELYSRQAESDTYVRRVDALIDAFPSDGLADLPRATKDGSRAVFIVGMPRCGSTLVERILGAHPSVHAAGEIPDFPRLARELPKALGSSGPFPACVAALGGPKGRSVVDRLQQRYLRALQRLSRGAERVVDKMLTNYMHLGLIELVMPGASVIHCTRDPMDTCLSCYAQGLLPSVHPYASDLTELGKTYRAYQRLMTHWRSVLDIPILEIEYETLIAEPERTSRALVESCGLPWDDACLSFHATPTFSNTISYDQVTRPIYKSSIGRHLHFQQHLEPLRRALGD